MERILNILKSIKNIVLFLAILALLVVIQLKNWKINNLKKDLAEKPKVEYVYKDSVQVIHDSIPQPYKVVEYKDKIVVDTLDLTSADSAQIAEAYIKVFLEYNKTNFYNDTLKNDTTAFISLYQEVTKNSIQDRKLTFIDRTPVVYITNTVTKEDKTLSITGGLGASVGPESSVSVRAGIVTPSNRVYNFSYDPFTKQKMITVDFPIFNIKK